MLRIFCLLVFTLGCAFSQDWNSFQTSLQGKKIEVRLRDGSGVQGAFASSTADSIVVRTKAGEQSFPKNNVRRVSVQDPSRRARNGLITTAIGLGAGIGVGYAVCVSCANEGAGGKYVGPGAAIGAGLGALGFLSAPYRTIYKSK